MGGKGGLVLPVVKDRADARLLHDGGTDLRTASHRNLGAALGRPGNVAGELNHVAVALVGDQQQPAVRQRRAVPLRPVGRRQQLGRIGEPKAPLILLPAAPEIAVQQRGLGNPKMRPGKVGIECERAFGARDRLIELEAEV
jgi:hypothetical protein